ncbi:hypothetical protein [Rubidibacter lacunae]|uniref:hypothetical protein n=1 Tax=Rubidibacter lacunae TaxID=582514 RepID=UPI0012EC818D|nr:hypothetical protein [Rubidibacter lacunae]
MDRKQVGELAKQQFGLPVCHSARDHLERSRRQRRRSHPNLYPNLAPFGQTRDRLR